MKICVATDVHPAGDQRINKEMKSLKKIADVIFISPPGNPSVEVEHVEIEKFESRFKRILLGPRRVYREVLKVRPDFFHFHDPELIPIGIKLAKRGIKVIYDVHENYPAVILTKNYIPRWLRKIVSKVFEIYEDHAARKFHGVVAVTENVCERFSRFTRCALVPNYPDLDVLSGFEKMNRNDGKIRFIYVGSIDEDRAIAQMLEAFRMLRKERDDVELLMVGPIHSRRLEEFIRSFDVDGFEYHPPVEHRKALEMIARSDVGLLVIHRNESKEISSPVKMFEYMYFNLPIVASNFPYWRKYIGSCAVFVEPEDPISILSGMKRAIDMIGKVKCKDLVEKFSWKVCEKELLKLYRG